jgi:hypothetical protein
MDDGIGNIVYIVLTILFIVIGLAGKKKPKQVPVSTNLTDDEDPSSEDIEAPAFKSFNDLFGDLIQGNEPLPEPLEMDQYKEVSEVEYAMDSPLEKIDSLEDSLDSIVSEDLLDNQVEHIETIPDFIKLTEVGGVNENKDLSVKDNKFIEELDIEKAVVYSEILNPKYF